MKKWPCKIEIQGRAGFYSLRSFLDTFCLFLLEFILFRVVMVRVRWWKWILLSFAAIRSCDVNG